MHTPPESLYIISVEEIIWGGILVAITMAIHGFGMLIVLRFNHTLKTWLDKKRNIMSG